MKAAHIIGNKVSNVILVNDLSFPVQEGYLTDNVGNYEIGFAQPGGYFIDNKFYPPRPSNEEQSENRRKAYEKEADPIFFLIQRGEATQEEWEAKVAEIKERYPYYFDDEGNLLEAM